MFKTEEKYCMTSAICELKKKKKKQQKIQMKLFTLQNRKRLTGLEDKLMLPGGKG